MFPVPSRVVRSQNIVCHRRKFFLHWTPSSELNRVKWTGWNLPILGSHTFLRLHSLLIPIGFFLIMLSLDMDMDMSKWHGRYVKVLAHRQNHIHEAVALEWATLRVYKTLQLFLDFNQLKTSNRHLKIFASSLILHFAFFLFFDFAFAFASSLICTWIKLFLLSPTLVSWALLERGASGPLLSQHN